MANEYDPYDVKIIATERDAGMKWSDVAKCGHTRADMLAAQNLGPLAAMGGAGIVNLDTRCEKCDEDQLECESHLKELDEIGVDSMAEIKHKMEELEKLYKILQTQLEEV